MKERRKRKWQLLLLSLPPPSNQERERFKCWRCSSSDMLRKRSRGRCPGWGELLTGLECENTPLLAQVVFHVSFTFGFLRQHNESLSGPVLVCSHISDLVVCLPVHDSVQ